MSEFLRDRDHRRVTMQSVPLIANDSDFDEPEGEAVRRSTSRNTTSQRSDAFPRIRRRLIERSANDAQSWCLPFVQSFLRICVCRGNYGDVLSSCI